MGTVGKVVIILPLQGNSSGFHLVNQEGQGFLQHLTHIHGLQGWRARPGKIQKLFNDLIDPLDLGLNDGQILFPRDFGGHLIHQGVDQDFNTGQRIADLVGDAGGKFAQRRQFFRLEKLPLGLLQLGRKLS